jgi:hypothetical protein
VSDRIPAIESYRTALVSSNDGSAAAVAGVLADDVVVLTNFGRADGIDAAATLLVDPRIAAFVSGGQWSEPVIQGSAVVVTVTQPPSMPIGGVEFAITLRGDKIARVEQRLLPAPPLEPAELRLTDDMKRAIDGALDNQTPMLLAYVDDREQIHLSFRGTVQAFGDGQLALWARDPGAGLPRNIAAHPSVTLFYHDPTGRTTYSFYGHAHVESDPDLRAAIFDNSNPREQNMDYHRRGAAIVVDLDRVEGRGPGGRVLMVRTEQAPSG